jgi:alpha-tubulin suppressor-like RCC1 family protein
VGSLAPWLVCSLAAATPVAAGESPLAIGATPARLAAGSFHTCAVAADGGVRCWGHGVRGQLGNGASADSAAPVPVRGLAGAVEVAAGEWFSCARKGDGTVWCWGGNEHGQLANGGGDRPVPVRIPVEGALQIAAGQKAACARAAADVWCWGQLGIESRTKPISLGIAGARDVSMGAIHGCVVTSDARVRCFGSNYSGQLGGPAKGLVGAPLPQLSGVEGVSAGGYQSCAWLASGALFCWGNNEYGSMRQPTAFIEREPAPVTALGEVAWARSGYGLTCALGRDHVLRCLGANGMGQLGPKPASLVGVPTELPVGPVVEVALGGRHLCARLADDSLSCWGANYWGELGDGTTRARSEPRTVSWGP